MANNLAINYQDEAEELFGNQLWRLNNLYWIIDEKGHRVKFQMTAVQLDLFIEMWFMELILKSRQHGITTDKCIFMLDTSLFNSNTSCAIIADNQKTAQKIFETKVKYPYENLDGDLKALLPANTDSAMELKFSNNSSILVSSSVRGLTVQYLHISEYGKICCKYPEKAREIKTGALNTVHAGQFISIESTAEGNSGDFYEYAQQSQKDRLMNVNLTPLDFKFFFYGWFEDSRNEIDPAGIPIPEALQLYFKTLESLPCYWRGNEVITGGIHLSVRKKAWYAKKWKTQGEDMKREHPSTPDEAFETRVEGSYFKSEFERIYRENRITTVPHTTGIPVDTFWDIGMDDTTDIWFIQPRGQGFAVIDFLEHNGEGLAYYARQLREKAQLYKYEYGRHLFPHDVKVREWGPGKDRIQQAHEYGIKAEPVPMLPKEDQIEAARAVLGLCWFDEQKCADGVKRLENYRHEWDDRNGCYRTNPLHDWACFEPETYLLTKLGKCRIIDLPNKGEVLTLCGWKEYQNPRMTRRNAQLVEVAFEDGTTVRCTPDHLFLTENGWKSAESLMKGTMIQSSLIRSHSILEKYRKTLNPCVVTNVVKLQKPSDVWCLTVPSVGHFSLLNGAIVHNCNAADAFEIFAVSIGIYMQSQAGFVPDRSGNYGNNRNVLGHSPAR